MERPAEKPIILVKHDVYRAGFDSERAFCISRGHNWDAFMNDGTDRGVNVLSRDLVTRLTSMCLDKTMVMSAALDLATQEPPLPVRDIEKIHKNINKIYADQERAAEKARKAKPHSLRHWG